MRVLAADIGGTNARLALVEIEDGRARVLRRNTTDSRRFDGFAAMVGPFLEELERRPDRASIAIAGPVLDGSVRPPNLDWTIEVGSVGSEIGIEPALVLNDFDAVASAVPHLGPEDLEVVLEGDPDAEGAIAVLGAGTGLGVSFLGWDGTRHRIVGSEGGHVDFAPRNETEEGLLRFLRDRYGDVSRGHVSYERVLSGPGLEAIYDFLVGSNRFPDDPGVRAAMEDRDPAAVIAERARAGDHPAATAAVELLFDVYGAMAGSLALLVQAQGGVYLAGGIAQQNAWALRTGRFAAAFLAKGRMRGFMERIPVRLIMRDDVGLLGAAYAARDL